MIKTPPGPPHSPRRPAAQNRETIASTPVSGHAGDENPLPLQALLGQLTAKGLRRESPTREEALAVLATSDDDLLDVVAAAGKVRRHWFGRRVKLNYLVNLKSGLCPEDCSYCSQRLGSKADILKYTWIKPDEASHGVTYQQIDAFLQGQPVDQAAFDIIVATYRKTQHKRELPFAP